MSENQPNRPTQPDRAGDGLDDLDVPTYQQHSGQSVYERAGRAAPQSIPANPPQQDAQPTGPAEQLPQQPQPRQPEPENETRVLPRRGDEHSRPLRSDAPTSSHDRPTRRPPRTAPPAPPTAAETGQLQAVSGPEPTAATAATATAAAAPTTALASSPTPPTQPAQPDDIFAEEYDSPPDTDRPDHRRGTMDLGLLLLRIVGGLWLILHALQVFFQIGDNPGINGLEEAYSQYYMGQLLAVAVPAAELAGGVFLLLGLITPLFAAVATVATGFTAIHQVDVSGVGLDLFAWSDAVWLSLVLLGISVVLQFTGPGFYSLDYSRGWARRPLTSSWVFIVLGVVALGLVWWFGAGVNPLN